tara:strand:- start:852 stop:1292 length:441 start_codon:yes stop_codon:yes gene_type:complete
MPRKLSHRQRIIAAAKRQMEENGVEFSTTKRSWSTDDVYVQGVRSPNKVQRNQVNRMRRAQNRLIRDETARIQKERGTDSYGRDWTPMPEGSLVQFTKNDVPWNSPAKKGDLATVVKEFESDGKRFVEVLLGSQVITVSKGALKEL